MCFRKRNIDNIALREATKVVNRAHDSLKETVEIGLRPWMAEREYAEHRYTEGERVMRLLARALYGQIPKENAISTFEAWE